MILTIPPLYYLHWRQLETKASGDFNVGRSCSVRPSSSAFLEIHLKFVCQNLEAFVFFFLSRHFESNHSRFCEIPPSTSRILMPKTSPNIRWLRSAQTFCLSLTAFCTHQSWSWYSHRGPLETVSNQGDPKWRYTIWGPGISFFPPRVVGNAAEWALWKVTQLPRKYRVFRSRNSECGVEDVWHLCPRKNGIRFVLSTCLISYHIKQVLVTSAISGRIKEVEIKFWWCGHGRTSW